MTAYIIEADYLVLGSLLFFLFGMFFLLIIDLFEDYYRKNQLREYLREPKVPDEIKNKIINLLNSITEDYEKLAEYNLKLGIKESNYLYKLSLYLHRKWIP